MILSQQRLQLILQGALTLGLSFRFVLSCSEVFISLVDHSFDAGLLGKEMTLGDVAFVSQDSCEES